MFDVIVVGAGPGGSVAAKKCAQHGLRTLLLERRRLPRDKVCSGMVMNRWAQTLVEKEFGQIPQEVLTIPHHLSGLVSHVVGVGSIKVEHKMPIAWRRDLDYWMNQKAREVGVEVWENARVRGVIEDGDSYIVTLEENRIEKKVRARFIIGADGATSAVRKSMFSNLKIQFLQVLQECYRGILDLEKEYFHFFYFTEIGITPSFDASHKGDFFIVDVMARTGELKKLDLLYRAKEVLSKEYGFNLKLQPLWKVGCVQPLMNKELISGSFSPCKGNILLVGEAAGLIGIGEAIWSGLMAATSITQATETGKKAEKFYMNEMSNIISNIILMRKELAPWARNTRGEATKTGQHLLEVLAEFWDKNLNMDFGYLSSIKV